MTDLYMKRGDDASFSVEVTALDGVTPQTIAGATLKFTAKDRLSDADVDAIIALVTGSGIVHDDEPNGLATITIPKTSTSGFSADRTLVWDLQVTGAGGEVKTVDSGRIFVQLDVTQAG